MGNHLSMLSPVNMMTRTQSSFKITSTELIPNAGMDGNISDSDSLRGEYGSQSHKD
jgi:hypothetical protein